MNLNLFLMLIFTGQSGPGRGGAEVIDGSRAGPGWRRAMMTITSNHQPIRPAMSPSAPQARAGAHSSPAVFLVFGFPTPPPTPGSPPHCIADPLRALFPRQAPTPVLRSHKQSKNRTRASLTSLPTLNSGSPRASHVPFSFLFRA
ncbi:hypothetical protein DFH11DRAFT_219315 [Phellopilus nigrolimitatus]|nr:hypothetical protein DFH11DRAFT_219315 [Phellopilus nigrolimitatus]